MSEKDLEQVTGGQIEPQTPETDETIYNQEGSKRDLDRLYGKAPVIELDARRPEFNRN